MHQSDKDPFDTFMLLTGLAGLQKEMHEADAKIRQDYDAVLAVLVQRLEALEAWRLQAESELARRENDDEGRWLPGAGVAFPHRKAQDRAGEEND